MSRPVTILLADDEPHILYVLEAKLASAGFRVLSAADGRQALALALAERPELLITDLNMPIMDGLTLSQTLKNDPATSGTPVIMLTGRGHTLTQEELASTNVCHLEAKPFSARQLLTVVEDLLARRQAA